MRSIVASRGDQLRAGEQSGQAPPVRRRGPVAYGGAAVLAAVVLLLSSCLFTPGNPGPASIRFDIDVSLDQHAISPLIYGLNSNDAATVASTRTTAIRMGGNRWTAYNWENNASNAGSDWCFQNDGLLSASSTPGAAVKPTITQAKNAGATAIVTVPIVDYVAADKNGGCDVRNSGPNYLQTRFKQNKSTKPHRALAHPERHRRRRVRGRVRELGQAGGPWRQHRLLPRQRARSLVVDPRRGAPRQGHLHRAGQPQHRLRLGDQAGVADGQGHRSGELRLQRVREPPERARRLGQGRVPRLVPRSHQGRQHDRRHATRRRPRPALVPRGHRWRRAHHRHRHGSGRRRRP